MLTTYNVWSTHDPEEGLEWGETSTKVCSFSILVQLDSSKILDSENHLAGAEAVLSESNGYFIKA